MSRTLIPDLSHSARLTSLCLAGGLVVGGFCATELLAQQNRQGQQGERTAGSAMVRERSGPSVEAQPGQQPRVIVLFPKASDSSGASAYGGAQQSSSDIRIICLDRPSQQQSGQQGQQGQQTGQQGQEQEIVFSSDNAVNGLVSYNFGGQQRGVSQGQGQGRSLSFIAESGGERLKVEQAVQRDNVVVLTVKRDPQEQQRQQQAQNQGNQQSGGSGQAQVSGQQGSQQASGGIQSGALTIPAEPGNEQAQEGMGEAQTAGQRQGQGQQDQSQQGQGQQGQGQQGQGQQAQGQQGQGQQAQGQQGQAQQGQAQQGQGQQAQGQQAQGQQAQGQQGQGQQAQGQQAQGQQASGGIQSGALTIPAEQGQGGANAAQTAGQRQGQQQEDLTEAVIFVYLSPAQQQ